MLTFGTLGPEESNHMWVVQRYLAFHELRDTAVISFDDFHAAFSALFRGDIQHIVQVAVHPSVAECVAQYRGRAHIIDTFVSPSQGMSVLTRSTVTSPTTLALPAPARGYVDTSKWERVIEEATTASVLSGLLEAKYDSGLTLTKYAQRYPELLQISEEVGTVDDAWLVYGLERTCAGQVQAWPQSPAAALFKRSEYR